MKKKKMQKKMLVIVTSIHPRLGISSSSFIVHLYSVQNKKYIGFQHSHVLITILILMHYLTVLLYNWDSMVTIKELGFPGQTIKSLSAMLETWEGPWMEEPGGLPSMGLQIVGHN